jgi:hypothetical protein
MLFVGTERTSACSLTMFCCGRESGHAARAGRGPSLTDTVEKVFWGWRLKFFRAADAFRAQRCEGPRRFSEKRPRTFVSAIWSIPAAALSKNQHLRDFWRRSIFDFFNSIDPNRTPQRATRARWFKAPSKYNCRPDLVEYHADPAFFSPGDMARNMQSVGPQD